MNFDNRELEKAFKESEEQQALLKMNYLDRFLKYHSDAFGEMSFIIYIIEVMFVILFYITVMALHASGDTECYYSKSTYGYNQVLAQIAWSPDRIVFVSEDYSEVKEYLAGKEMCK